MTKGAPDGTVKFANEGYLGQGITAYSISGAAAAGATIAANLFIPLANTENILIHIITSVNDDTAIHVVRLNRVADGYTLFYMNFINNVSVDIPTLNITAGEIVAISFTNNSDVVITFTAVVYWITRSTL